MNIILLIYISECNNGINTKCDMGTPHHSCWSLIINSEIHSVILRINFFSIQFADGFPDLLSFLCVIVVVWLLASHRCIPPWPPPSPAWIRTACLGSSLLSLFVFVFWTHLGKKSDDWSDYYIMKWNEFEILRFLHLEQKEGNNECNC